jgi:hypothetical protein
MYMLTLLKIKDSMGNEGKESRNRECLNIEAELREFMPVYLSIIDEVSEEQVTYIIDECDRMHYFNFELIKAVKDTIQKRRAAIGSEIGG